MRSIVIGQYVSANNGHGGTCCWEGGGSRSTRGMGRGLRVDQLIAYCDQSLNSCTTHSGWDVKLSLPNYLNGKVEAILPLDVRMLHNETGSNSNNKKP